MEDNKSLNEEVEKLFWKECNPKIGRTREDLRRNKDFMKEIDALRKKWADLIKEYISSHKEITDKLEKEASLITAEEKDTFSSVFEKLLKTLKKKEHNYPVLFKKTYSILKNNDFDKDVISLCDRYKLYPIDLWIDSVKTLIALDEFFPASYWLLTGLSGYFSTKEILSVPPGLNFAPKIEADKKTKELKLSVHVLDDSSQRDIRKYLKIITECQKRLRKAKKNEKRSWPYRNLEKAKKLEELDKPREYYEPTKDKWVSEKMSETEKAKIIYGQIFKNKKEGGKFKNRLKTMRSRDRKRTKS